MSQEVTAAQLIAACTAYNTALNHRKLCVPDAMRVAISAVLSSRPAADESAKPVGYMWESVAQKLESGGAVRGFIWAQSEGSDEKDTEIALYRHPAPVASKEAVTLSDEVRSLIAQAAECISEAVTLDQDGFDEPPRPATQWDYNADQLAYALRAILAQHDASKAERKS